LWIGANQSAATQPRTQTGGINVAITMHFVDGEDWIVKIPKTLSDAAGRRLESNAATLLFLQKWGDCPHASAARLFS
jgi:hypothetical protein